MGIVSSAKLDALSDYENKEDVSIPDGDSFLREAGTYLFLANHHTVSIPDGDSFLREVAFGTS